MAARSLDCDGWSTTAFMLGMDAALAFIEDLEGVEAVLVSEAGRGALGRVALLISCALCLHCRDGNESVSSLRAFVTQAASYAAASIHVLSVAVASRAVLPSVVCM